MPGYPQLEKTNRMLELLHGELRKAYERGQAEVRLMFVSGGSFDDEGAGLFIDAANREGVGDRIGISNGEALALFRRLETEGYLHVDYGRERNSNLGFVRLLDLGERGYVQIGELPDPREQFIQGMEAAIQLMQADSSLPEEEKRRRINWFEEGKFVLRNMSLDAVRALYQGGIPPNLPF